MKIPFSPPYIDNSVEREVLDSLRSGWITSGPKVKALETSLEAFLDADACVCVNSWTSGAIMMLSWFGIGEGDEVIIPAYTYSATALAVLHCGAKPVMIDIGDDFIVRPEDIADAFTSRTKAVIPVDLAGLPADYRSILNVIHTKNHLFSPNNIRQGVLGRALLLSDSAHSLGSQYYGDYTNAADISIYSFHAVKNLTTAEGGAVLLNLPFPFDNISLKSCLTRYALNGQSKDALTKTLAGNWKYDILELGFKFNMPDICASIGLAQIQIFPQLLASRLEIFNLYNSFFSKYSWALTPPSFDSMRKSSAHLYLLRIKNITESQRDDMIQHISSMGVAVNVHYIPLPMFTLFSNLGYSISSFPNSYKQYSCEISLPLYPQLTADQIEFICQSVVSAYDSLKN